MLKPIAFYLPQYHPIPENDQWWGKDFTDWDNVRAARPCFNGHYQPHIPHRSVGYYDLRDANFLYRQHSIAKRYGLFGFCYYYYFFNGQKLLDTPLKILLNSPRISMNFCLCWANEPWTRAWYGQNKEILISNTYTEEHARRFLRDILPYLRDERYIRVNGSPLLLVYKPGDIPACQRYSAILREEAAQNNIPTLYLASVESLLIGADPAEFGFDGAVEFAPDWSRVSWIARENGKIRLADYRKTAINMLLKPPANYERFPGVFPGWDNTARYKDAGIAFVHANIGVFKYILETVAAETRARFSADKQLLFINAWNEWAEGCHLEPDQRNGFAYLEVVREIVEASRARPRSHQVNPDTE